MPKMMVYVDGFNVYHGLFDDEDDRPAQFPASLKWLDLVALSQRLFPDDELVGLRYFTASIKDTHNDPRKAERQDAYLKALDSLDKTVIKMGKFKRRKQKLPLWVGNEKVWVARLEEKGSDVNLATALVKDLYEERFEKAVVFSNDTDLVTPLQLASSKGKEVVIVNPSVDPDHLSISKTPNVRIRAEHLTASQLPFRVRLKNGREIRKPELWG